MKKQNLKKLRKVFSMVLSLVMVMSALSCVSVTANATLSGTCGDNVKWVLNRNTQVLTISGTGDMANYTKKSNPPWLTYQSSIYEIIIKQGVTSIGDYAFYNTIFAEKVTIPDSVTSIGEGAFYYSDISSVIIPDGVKNIEDYTFYGCDRLNSITFPDEMDSIGSYAFYNCSELESITLPDGIPGIASNMFYGCESLASVNIPETVQTIGKYAFSSCTNLASVTLPEWLKEIEVSAFAYSGLTSIVFPKNLTTIKDKTFYSCDALTSVVIPDGITTIGDSAFEGCENLSTVTISESVTGIDFFAFRDCSNLTSINVDSLNTSYSSVDGVLFNYDQTVLICYPAGKVSEHYVVPDTVEQFSYYAFAYANHLSAVTIPEKITYINSWAFSDCENLADIIIHGNITGIGMSAFYGCKSLEDIIIPGSVTSIGMSAFYGCKNLSLVHYLGTEDSWTTVLESTDTNNNYLIKATIHYCQQKTIDGTCINTGFENGWYCDDCQKHIIGGIPTEFNPGVHGSDTYTDDGYRDCCGEYQSPTLNDENVYEIYNAGQLFGFAELVNNGEKNADAILMADINLKGAEWVPICSTSFYCSDDYTTGDNYPDTGYSGTFDGNGFVISNVSVSAVSGEKCTYGIFGTVSGTVKNVGVDKLIFYINNATEVCVGGIVGQIIGGAVENCFVTNSVIAPVDFVAGGIAGCNFDGIIKNCYTSANTISGNSASRYGHIVGDNHGDGGDTDRPGTVTDCYTDGAVAIGIRKGFTENVSVLSSESFSNGELAYLLNRASAEQTWGQESNQDGATPVLDPTGLYKVVPVANTDNYTVANMGDTNSDGIVDTNDYQAIVNMALSNIHSQSGTESYDDIVKYDMDGDGQLDVLDASLTERLLNGHTTAEVYAVGDYDADGEAFTENDVIAMAKAMTIPESLSTAQKYACDMNADGKVDEADLTILQKSTRCIL